MTTLLREEDRDRGLKCVAQLMHLIRPDWEFNGCLAVLRKLPADRPLPVVARAAVWFAEHRTQQRTPAMLAEDGRHWHLDDVEHEPGVVVPPPWKPPPPPENPLTPERARQIRQQAKEQA